MTPARLLRDGALAVVAVGWAVAAHFASAGETSSAFGVALAVLPFAAALIWGAWRLAGPVAALAGGAVGLWALVRFWPELQQNVSLLYFLQHAGINLALAAFFGRTLAGPGEALVTRLARTVYGDNLTDRKIRYTRQVTLAWTLFFTANALLSAVLYALAPIAVWSVYANLLGGPLIVAMFIGEHLWRRRVLPPEERPNLATVIRAWREHQSRTAA